MIITTERLTVRRIEDSDWENIKKIWDDQQQSVYAQYDRPNDTDPDAVRKRVEKWASCANSMEHMFFAVCLNGILIGYAVFNKHAGVYELGYCFLSEYHGKGYARESISALLPYIQTVQPGVTIAAGTALLNLPSVKLLDSLGFRQTGTEQVSFYKDANGRDIYFDGGIFEWNYETY